MQNSFNLAVDLNVFVLFYCISRIVNHFVSLSLSLLENENISSHPKKKTWQINYLNGKVNHKITFTHDFLDMGMHVIVSNTKQIC